MATETSYQSKIIKSIIAIGGRALTGKLKTGESDIQGGYPAIVSISTNADITTRVYVPTVVLLDIAIEVKTPDNYKRVMRAIKEVDGLYEIIDKTPLKEHESLQIYKINDARKRGGLALIAHSFEQVQEYVNARY